MSPQTTESHGSGKIRGRHSRLLNRTTDRYIGVAKWTRRATQVVFSDLSPALEALRGLYGRTGVFESGSGTSTALRSPQDPGTLIFPAMPAGQSEIDSHPSLGLDTFILEEDPNHLEEAVLIALDHMPQTETPKTTPELAYRRFRIDLDSPSTVPPRGRMRLIRPMLLHDRLLDDLYDRESE
jgi:hypothetical protein